MGEFSVQRVSIWTRVNRAEELESIVNQPKNAMTELERSFDLTWCNCGECIIMPSRREMAEYLSQSATCITRHQNFELVCLNSAVFERNNVCWISEIQASTWQSCRLSIPTIRKYACSLSLSLSLCLEVGSYCYIWLKNWPAWQSLLIYNSHSELFLKQINNKSCNPCY